MKRSNPSTVDGGGEMNRDTSSVVSSAKSEAHPTVRSSRSVTHRAGQHRQPAPPIAARDAPSSRAALDSCSRPDRSRYGMFSMASSPRRQRWPPGRRIQRRRSAAASVVIGREHRRVVARGAPDDVVVVGRAPDDVVDRRRRAPDDVVVGGSRAPHDVVVVGRVPQTMLSQSAPPQSVPHTMLSSPSSVPHTMLSSPRTSCPRRCCRRRTCPRRCCRRSHRRCPTRCCRRRRIVPQTMLSPCRPGSCAYAPRPMPILPGVARSA